MSGLISSNEAKLAWANGEQLQVAHLTQKVWETLTDNYMLSVFDADSYVFRLTPRTITINGIEVPAPFEPMSSDSYFIVNPYAECGYSEERYSINYTSLGAWRTEEEIKQAVSALRSVFKVRD